MRTKNPSAVTVVRPLLRRNLAPFRFLGTKKAGPYFPAVLSLIYFIFFRLLRIRKMPVPPKAAAASANHPA